MSNELYNQITWESFKIRVKNDFNIDFVKIDDFFKKGYTWLPLEDHEDLEDIDILNCLANLRTFEGILCVVTDASYQKNLGPFQVKSEDISSFVINHWNNFGERFLETDVLIINFQLKLAWIFHHEGVYSLIDLKKTRGDGSF